MLVRYIERYFVISKRYIVASICCSGNFKLVFVKLLYHFMRFEDVAERKTKITARKNKQKQ